MPPPGGRQTEAQWWRFNYSLGSVLTYQPSHVYLVCSVRDPVYGFTIGKYFIRTIQCVWAGSGYQIICLENGKKRVHTAIYAPMLLIGDKNFDHFPSWFYDIMLCTPLSVPSPYHLCNMVWHVLNKPKIGSRICTARQSQVFFFFQWQNVSATSNLEMDDMYCKLLADGYGWLTQHLLS